MLHLRPQRQTQRATSQTVSRKDLGSAGERYAKGPRFALATAIEFAIEFGRY